MPKELDPNHLALMKAVRTAVEDLRKVRILILRGDERDAMETVDAVTDHLRLTLKGRIGS